MSEYHYVNNPSMGLKKFMGMTGIARGKIYENKVGKIRLLDGVTMLAKAVMGSVASGEEVVVVGIDNTKLLVESFSGNAGEVSADSEISDKISELQNSIEISRIMEKIDLYIANEEGEKAEVEIEKLERLTLSPEEFIDSIRKKAEKYEEDGELKKALKYYKRVMLLKRSMNIR